jgi:hypothetical protein
MESSENIRLSGEPSELLQRPNQNEASTEHAESSLESLRQLPLRLDQSYAEPLAEALDTLEPGIYDQHELVELVSEDAARFRGEQQKVAAALHTNDRSVKLQDRSWYLEPATDSANAKEQLTSTRVERLVDCLQSVDSYNKEPKLGDCMAMARALGLLPTDEDGEKLFKALFTRHPRIRVESSNQKVHTVEATWQPPATIGEALDKLTHVAKVTVLSERMLINRAADFVAIDEESRGVLAKALALDKRFSSIGKTHAGPVYKLHARHDLDKVHELQQAAEAYIAALREQGGRHYAELPTLLQDAADKGFMQRLREPRAKIFSLLIESQPGVSLLRKRSDNDHPQFIITPSEVSAPTPAADFVLPPAPMTAENTVAAPETAPVPEASEIPEKLSAQQTLENVRQTPLAYDRTYETEVAASLPRFSNGAYAMLELATRIIKLSNIPASDHGKVMAALQMSEHVLPLTTTRRQQRECYLTAQQPDPVFEAIDQFVTYLGEADASISSSAYIPALYKLAKEQGYAPSEADAGEHFIYLLKKHPRVSVKGVAVEAILPAKAAEKPRTIGEALDQYVAGNRTAKTYTVARFSQDIFKGCAPATQTYEALEIALALDDRFQRVDSDQGTSYRLVPKDQAKNSPALHTPETLVAPTVTATPEASLESEQQRSNRLAGLASRVIRQLIDEETITMPAARIIEFAQAQSGTDFSASDEQIILGHVAKNSRLRRVPHHPLDLFVERSVPEKYTYDEQDEVRVHEAEQTPRLGRPGGNPRRLPRRHNRTGPLINPDDIPAREYRRIKRIEQLLAIYEKQRVERMELERMATKDTTNGRDENRRRKKYHEPQLKEL